MTDTTGVALQANFRTPGGALLNVYAPDHATFKLRLAQLFEEVELIAQVELQLNAATAVAPIAAAPTYQPQQPSATPPQVVQPAHAPLTGSPSCAHGPRVHRTGTSAATGKAWQAYFCSAPQSVPKDQQCEAVWVR
jgi:hypothetical protein